MNNFWRIIKFEFLAITAKKSWLIPTFIFVLVGLIVAFLPQIAGLVGFDSFLDSLPSETAVEQPQDMATTGVALITSDISQDEVRYFLPQAEFFASESELEQAVLNDQVDEGYVVASPDKYIPLYKDTSVTAGRISPFEDIMLLMRQRRLIGDALDHDSFFAAMNQPLESEPRILGTDGQTNFGFTYGLMFVVYFLVIFYGTTISTSVAREKSDRTMELLITSANPSKLFYGKVFGAGLAGLLQFSMIVATVFLGFSLNHKAWGFNILRYFNIPPRVLVIFLALTLVGYLLYLFFYAMLGSMVSKVEDVSTASMPIMLLMVASFLIVNMSMYQPDSTIMQIASYVPFSSPFAMFARSALGSSVTNLEVLISLAILIASAVIAAIISSKLYRLGTLNYGNRLKIGQAIRLLRKDAK